MQKDDLLPISISDIIQSPYTPDSYSAPSIPRRSPLPTPTSTVILSNTAEPISSKLNTAEIEVVDLADSTYDLDSKDSE